MFRILLYKDGLDHPKHKTSSNIMIIAIWLDQDLELNQFR